ncbi:MAG: hypothetical protein KGL35_24765 [Bradyrhizobium sp.]|nr:hypothetical protein [Bradyrhizobium sp.]
MSDYRRDFRGAQSEYYWSMPRIGLALFLGLVALGVVGFGANLLMQPGRIMSKTLDADNVIQNYEWFHDANGNYLARVAQIKQFKALATSETDPQEKSRLRIDMAAIQQSCRDLSRRYNANADKMNRGIFRERSLPDQLNSGDCE